MHWKSLKMVRPTTWKSWNTCGSRRCCCSPNATNRLPPNLSLLCTDRSSLRIRSCVTHCATGALKKGNPPANDSYPEVGIRPSTQGPDGADGTQQYRNGRSGQDCDTVGFHLRHQGLA